jgi:hypothetical protein
MEILTLRDPTRGDATAGYVLVDGVFECHSLEDVVRLVDGAPASVENVKGRPVGSWKIPEKTAIPEGRYPVTIALSPRFRKLMISIGEVPAFSGIRAHGGLEPDHTEGCPLLGDQMRETDAGPRIVSGHTQGAVARLQQKIQAALDRGEAVFWTFKQNPAGSREAQASA